MASGIGKPADLFKEIKQLDGRYIAVCREKEAQLYKRGPTLYSELSDLDKKMSQDLRAEKVKTKKEIYRIKNLVNRFQSEVTNVKPTPEFLEKLKVIMEDIEANILQFKESQREGYEELMMSEVQISHEINALEKRFDSWSKVDHNSEPVKKPVTKLPTARDVVKNLPPQVAQFEKFIQETGGMRGGWDEYDHSTFLKWRVRIKGRQEFLGQATSHLPTKTADEVAEHEDWYRQFLSLQELKKQAIREWKLKKAETKEEKLAEMESSDSGGEDDKEKREEQMRRERVEKARKLSAWKLQKELERAEAEEKQRNEEAERQEQQREERLRQQDLKQKVMEYRQQKKQEQYMVDLETQMISEYQTQAEKEQQQLNKQRIELRNQYALEQKVRQVRKAEEAKEQRARREEKLKAQYQVSVSRDPNRLLQPTAGWKSHTKEVGASSEAGRVYSMPHRAIPSWRQGL